LDRFTFKEQPEPKVCGYCPECEESICEGDEIVTLRIDNTMVHMDCFMDFILKEVDCDIGYAGEGFG
jgi:hypothetical protein